MTKIIQFLFSLLCFLSVQTLNAQLKNPFPPVEYVENLGQWDGPFQFKGVTSRGDIYLRKDGFTINFSDVANHEKMDRVHHGLTKDIQKLNFFSYQVNFLGCNKEITLSKEKEQSHYYNYFLGNNPSRWKSNIHPALAVNYHNLYNQIDAHVYSESANVKYDLIAHAGSDVNIIQLEYKGAEGIRIEKNNLIIKTSLGDMTELAPYAYQYVHGERVEVKCNYKLKDQIVRFEFPKGYQKQLDLYIDPTMVFCSFTGSTTDNWGFTATNDTLGNFYAGGIVTGTGYPVTPGAYQPNFAGGTGTYNQLPCDMGISKFSSTGNALLWATYLGGTDDDQPQSIIVDKNQNLCIAGRTYSNNYPTSVGCYDPTYNGGGDLVVTKLNSLGTALIGSTYVGGSGADASNESPFEFTQGTLKHNYGDDARSEIIYDANNNVYVAACSESSNFPTSSNAFQNALSGLQDGVIVELDNTCSTLLWSTYAGGTANDAAYVLSLNKSNPLELFVAGGTMSSNFPSTTNVLNSTYQGGTTDGFVMKFNTSSKALLASTFIGTSAYDQVFGVQTDDSNHVYIMGQTFGAYPVTSGVFTNPNSSQFVTKLSNNLSTIMASSVFGTGTTSMANISPNAFLVDKCQNVYVSGWGGSIGGSFLSSTTGMPITSNALQSTTDGSDFYFIVYGKNLVSQIYGSYFGQNGGVSEHVDGGTSRFDENGVIYQAICAACGSSQIFPTTAGAYCTSNPSPNCNLAALKISFDLLNPYAVAGVTGPTSGCAPFIVTFTNTSTSATNYFWNFGDGTTSTQAIPPPHSYTSAGSYTITLIAANPNGCTANSDTTTIVVTVKADSVHADFTFVKKDTCDPFRALFTNLSTTNTGNPSFYLWDFGDGTTSTAQNPPLHTFPSGTSYNVTLTVTDTTACNSPSIISKTIDFSTSVVSAEFDMPDSVCLPAFISFIDQSTNPTTWNWSFGDNTNSSTPSPSHDYTATGLFTVRLIAGNPTTCNLFDTAYHTITVFPSPIADFSWTPNPPTPNTPNVFTNLSTGATKYLWDLGDGTTSTDKNVTHIYQKDDTYNVCLSATNEFGCTDTTCKKVRGLVVPLVDVPTGFSPNGDGVNDFVYVKGYGIQTMMFRIFNRWGEKVFETTDQSKGWDGKYKGILQEMEVYSYTLNVSFFDGSKDFKKGNITLLK